MKLSVSSVNVCSLFLKKLTLATRLRSLLLLCFLLLKSRCRTLFGKTFCLYHCLCYIMAASCGVRATAISITVLSFLVVPLVTSCICLPSFFLGCVTSRSCEEQWPGRFDVMCCHRFQSWWLASSSFRESREISRRHTFS